MTEKLKPGWDVPFNEGQPNAGPARSWGWAGPVFKGQPRERNGC